MLIWRRDNSNASEYSLPHLIGLEALSLHAVFPEGQDAVLKADCGKMRSVTQLLLPSSIPLQQRASFTVLTCGFYLEIEGELC